MGLGSTAKKLSKVADIAEDLYARMQSLREELDATRETVEATSDRVAAVEEELDEQRALLEALAEEQGVDAAAVGAGGAGEESESGTTAESAE